MTPGCSAVGSPTSGCGRTKSGGGLAGECTSEGVYKLVHDPKDRQPLSTNVDDGNRHVQDSAATTATAAADSSTASDLRCGNGADRVRG